MLKKTIPLFLVSALVLGGCTMNRDHTVPRNNETPMQDTVPARDKNWTPNVNDNNRGGTNLDGINDGVNGNGVNNGNAAPNDTIINDNMNKNNR